jgi:hypothetical protein
MLRAHLTYADPENADFDTRVSFYTCEELLPDDRG